MAARKAIAAPIMAVLFPSVLIFGALVLVTLAATPARSEAPGGHPPILRGETGQFTLSRPLRTAPLMPIRTGRGGVTNLTRFHGKIVLLNFWATWCLPCIREMPSLDRLQEALGGDDFTVVALSIDDGPEPVARFFARSGLKTLAPYLDPNGTSARAFKLFGLPMTYLIDRRGRIRGYITGAVDWDSRAARALIAYYIDANSDRAAGTGPAPR